MRYTGIHHLAMATHDMEATIRFWRDLLEMRLIVGLGRAGYRHYFFEISAHDSIAFFEWEHVENIVAKDHGVPVQGPLAFDHVSFGVAGEAELWRLKDRLEAAGFWVSELIDHGFILSIYTFDPNQIAIEFSAEVPGVDLRARPLNKDPDPVPAAMEGPDPQPGKWPPVTAPTPQADRIAYPGEGRILLEEES